MRKFSGVGEGYFQKMKNNSSTEEHGKVAKAAGGPTQVVGGTLYVQHGDGSMASAQSLNFQ